VEGDSLQAAHTQRGKSVVVFQVAKRALYGCASTVEAAEPLRMARDAREQATAERERQGWLVGLRTRSGITGSQPRSSHSA
jgi:hypothetical protein